MTKNVLVTLWVVLLTSCSAWAKHDAKRVSVIFVPRMGADTLRLGKQYAIANSTVQVDQFRWYVSSIRLFHQHMQVFTDTPGHHLLDAADSASLCVQLLIPSKCQFDSISFNLGIDSATNVAGAMSGDLDPTRGMYWTWQSGYINLKIEGKTPLSTARQHEFQLHIGGYTGAFATLRTVGLGVQESNRIVLATDILHIIQGNDFSISSSIMIPGKNAAACADLAVGMFSVLP